MKKKADYGIDAPYVVRNLFLLSLIFFIGAIFLFDMQTTLWLKIVFSYVSVVALVLLGSGCWMLYGIKVVKPKLVGKLVENLCLKGHEKILDLGCGRGLLLCEAAKHLPQGEAHGIDVWSNKDQSDNKPDKTLANAHCEGVKDRVFIHTGDIQTLPFPDAYFDAIVSSLCLHNIKDKQGRQRALLEGIRVLKPGGRLSIMDIHYVKEYTHFLNSQNMIIKYSKPDYFYCPPIVIFEAKKPEST